ncbi:putative heat shock protein 70 family, peptide-binding domain protein [Tanacetum coccineum]
MNPLLMFASPTLSASKMTKCAMMTSTTNNALFRGVPRRASQPRHTCGCSRLGQGQQHGNQFKRNQLALLMLIAAWISGSQFWLESSVVTMFMYSRVEIIPNEHDIKITRSCVLLGVTLDCCFATLYAYAKHLMGSRFSDSTVQKDIRSWPFIVVEETEKGMMGKKYNEDAELHKLKANVRQSGQSTCATLLRLTCPSPAWFKDHFINLLYVYA